MSEFRGNGQWVAATPEDFRIELLWEPRFGRHTYVRSEQPNAASFEKVASIRHLLEVEQYAVTDVALMFGVSRQRIDQYAEKYGMRPPRRMNGGCFGYRVWNDERNCFEPVRRLLIERRQRAAEWQKQRALRPTRSARREEVVAAIRELAGELGRAPSLSEVKARVTGRSRLSTGAWLGRVWFDDIRRIPNYGSRATAEAYAAAGVSPPRRGGWRKHRQ